MRKSGIDYFPLDVSNDSKLDLIEAEFGLTGFGVVVKLLQEIYGKQGYYIEWTTEVALLFARKVGLGGNAVSEIVKAAIRRGMFSQEIFEKYGILTSRGIQRRYFEAVSRRKEITVLEDILLVECGQICGNAHIRRENVDNSSKNADSSAQSREEKSRGKESTYEGGAKAATSPRRRFVVPTLEEVRAYCRERGNAVDAEKWLDYYASNGWKVGKNPMVDWKAAVRTWERRDRKPGAKPYNYEDGGESL